MKYINKFLVILIVLFIVIFGAVYKYYPKNKTDLKKQNNLEEIIKKLKTDDLVETTNYLEKNNIKYEIKEENNLFSNNKIINKKIKDNKIIIYISKQIDCKQYNIDESGNVPIMMYHGIHDKESKYIGGNIDKDGYQRTAKAFRKDLEFYYNSGYRMIKLKDYINGNIDVDLGKSPIILTFDDGLSNNIKVTGLDENGNIIIDPNSAVGILEEYKNKYPDFNITATFFINGGLFNQPEYNEKILNWLIDNNYDIGNHSYTHANFSNISNTEANKEIGKMYNLLDKYLPNKYLNIVALPFGSPYSKKHANYNTIINSNYNNKQYNTISTLRVGWEADYSPFNKNFDKMFLKRIRAYDNNGKDFDIEMNFKILENTKYISDGNKDVVTIPKEKENKINTNLKLNLY